MAFKMPMFLLNIKPTQQPLALMVIMIITDFLRVSSAQMIRVSSPWLLPTETYGPVIHVWCVAVFPDDTTDHETKWILSNRTLTVNDRLVAEGESSKYTVENRHGGYMLSIRNAVKEDAGPYQCKIEYNVNGKRDSCQKEVMLPIIAYLPSLSYPECGVKPSITLQNGTEAVFKCAVGESSDNVNLELTLVRSNGLEIRLGDSTSVTKTVTMDDNNAMFVCVMTSDTFLTARRRCSAGPIIVSLSDAILPVVATDWHFANSSKRATQNLTGAAIGGIVSTFLIIIIAVTIIVLFLWFKRSKRDTQPLRDNITLSSEKPSESNAKTSRYSSTRPLSDDWNSPIYCQVHKTSESIHTSVTQPRSSEGSGFVHNIVYSSSGSAVVNRGSNLKNDDDTHVYASTEKKKSTPPSDANPPIYSQVNHS